MAFKKIPLTIDTMIRNPVPIEGINQEDNIELNIVVTENKTPKDLSSQTIKVYVRRIDGTLVEQTNQITLTNARKGEVTVKLKNSAFNKEGYALFQLDVSDSIGRITSSYATFKIGKGLVSGEAIANTNEIEALKKVEEYIKKANQELETFKQTVTEINENEATRQENEVVRVREEASRNKAEAIRVQQEATRKEKENERVQAEIQRIADEEVRRENEALRGSKELERKQAEELRKEKELLRIADEKNRKVAESKRIEAESVRVEVEKLRVTGETERVGAESLRVIAEEKRVAAETKREEEFNKFESKINANTKELKNARTATTGEKFNSLDERIDCEVDRLNKKIDVTMLQQEDKESHVIENTVEGMSTDMVVKGKTLVNIVKSNRRICKKGASAYFQLIYPKLKTGKYTVILNASELTKEGITMYDMISSVQYPYNLKTGLNIRKIDVREEGSTYAVIVGNDNVDGTQFMLESLMILEGDWTNKPIPEYFESIKSFGQQEDKISILSHGKNLFDGNIEVGAWKDVGSLENAKYDISTLVRNTNPIKIKPNTQYIMNVDFAIRVNFYDKQGNLILQKSPLIENRKFISPPNSYYLCFNTSTQSTLNDVLNFKYQLEYGEVSTKYQKYISNKKDILLPFSDGLKSVGNVCDELVSNTKKAIERIQKDVFVGNEDWIIRDDIRLDDVTVFRLNSATRNQYKTDGFLICNKFNRYAKQYQNYEGIRLVGSEGYGVTIGISKSKLTTDDSMGFKNLLKKWNSEGNPLILYSEMTTPVEHDLPSNLEVNTYQDKTYVEFQNSISGTSSFKAPVDSATTIARLNRENRALEEENKTLRQDFESTTLSLTDSDLELVKQNVDMDFRLMEVEFALDIPQAILSSNINFKKKGEVKSMARTPYAMMKIVILSGDYDREDYIHKVGKYYERGRMTKEEYDELMSLMTADEVIGG